jgi:hypothetical protein
MVPPNAVPINVPTTGAKIDPIVAPIAAPVFAPTDVTYPTYN